MDKEVCFFINGNTLFLDKVLVSFNDTPIFFVCCDSDKKYYIVLCTNMEDLEYIVVSCSPQLLYQMLSKKVEMRKPFISANNFWNIKAGETVENDEVQYLESDKLDLDDLPYPNAFYEARKKDDIEYVERIAASYFVEDNFCAMDEIADVDKKASTLVGMSLEFVAQIEQYFDCAPLLNSSFAGRQKKFVISGVESDAVSYMEYETHDANTLVGLDYVANMLTSDACLAA